MKTKISLIGYLIGFLIVFGSYYRWFIVWYDPSQAIIGVSLGLILIILSYIYSFMKQTEEELKKHEKRLDAFATWMMNEERTTIEAEVRGEE